MCLPNLDGDWPSTSQTPRIVPLVVRAAMTAPWLWPRALPGTINPSPARGMGKRILCPLMPVDQGPPCPCSLALQAPGMAYTHYASCFNTDSHASPWKPASADTALGTVTPAVPQQKPQSALRVPETQDTWSWKCAFLQSPVPGPWAGKPCLMDRRQRGKDTGIPSVWGQETEGEARPLKQACLCTRSPGPIGTGKDGLSLWRSGYHWCSLCLPAGRDTRL